jgi:catechol 2,3-dioxygenase-like lactoylglutathione lyase family enzyme
VFAQVTVWAADLDASERFYGTVLVGERPGFTLAPAPDPAAVTRDLHIAFVTRSRAEVDAFWRAGVEAGYQSDGEPGPRPVYGPDYYGGFLLDPDGNSAEAVHHGRLREGPCVIDHLWIRVSDLAAARRFWHNAAPRLGLMVYGARAERFHVGARDRSFALVHDGRPTTRNLELGFPVAADAAASELEGGVRDPDGNRIVAVRVASPPRSRG